MAMSPDAELDEQFEDEWCMPRQAGGRKPRRRRHRKNKSALAGDEPSHDLDDENAPSNVSGGFLLQQPQVNSHHTLVGNAATSTPLQLDRNVVTWSDLGGDCILKGLQGSSDQHRAPVPANASTNAARWQLEPFVQPVGPAPCMLPTPIASVALGQLCAAQYAVPEWANMNNPSPPYWLYPGQCAPQLLAMGAASPAATAEAIGKTAPAELAKLLQDLATEAYED